MSSLPEDQVQLHKVVGEHHLLEYFDVGRIPMPQAAVSIPYRDLAHELNVMLPNGPGKDQALRKLLESRNAAARVVFDQSEGTI